MKEHEINKFDNFIGGWYSDDYEDITLFDDIIEYHKQNKNKHQGLIGDNYLNTEIKDSTDCTLQSGDLFTRYHNYMQIVINSYIKKYPYSNYYHPWAYERYPNIQHYAPKQGFKSFHTERTYNNERRHLVYMTYLNTVEDGGETEFFHQKVLIKPKKGLTIIWPVDWTFTHRGLISKTENKYIITGWFVYVDNNFNSNKDKIYDK